MNVLVEKITGMNFLDYLKEKALLEIGFSEESWCVSAPDGYIWGGSGIMCTAMDLARFALLVMNGGNYNGNQLLPQSFVEAATTVQIDNSNYSSQKNSYYGQGYGYQIWITSYGFAFLGASEQLAICVPERDLVRKPSIASTPVKKNPANSRAEDNSI